MKKSSLLNIVQVVFISVCIGSLSGHAQKSAETVSLFDGATLEGWKTMTPENTKYWSVVDSTITGGDGTTKIPKNTYLYTTERYQDFELQALFRITGDHDKGLINSGIQYRSIVEDGKMIGYQADIGKGYWGDIYDEHRRAKLVGGDLSTLKFILNEEGWNSYLIRCQGNKHTTYINGVKTAEYIEKDPNIPGEGVIGFQLHSGGNAKVEFKNVTLTEL